MKLPILKSTHELKSADLLRHFLAAEFQWARHLGEETPLEFGVVVANPSLNRVYDANRVFDLSLPPGVDPRLVIASVEEFFNSRGCICHQWSINPSIDPARSDLLESHLLSVNFQKLAYQVLRAQSGVHNLKYRDDLQIIPARAGYRQARELASEQAMERWNEPQLADASMLHLDDPGWEALLALKDGIPAGMAGVLSMGEIGLIEEVYVSKKFRNTGVGQTLLVRMIEICARSLFKHVLLGVDPGNSAALGLYQKAGFAKVAEAFIFSRTR